MRLAVPPCPCGYIRAATRLLPLAVLLRLQLRRGRGRGRARDVVFEDGGRGVGGVLRAELGRAASERGRDFRARDFDRRDRVSPLQYRAAAARDPRARAAAVGRAEERGARQGGHAPPLLAAVARL